MNHIYEKPASAGQPAFGGDTLKARASNVRKDQASSNWPGPFSSHAQFVEAVSQFASHDLFSTPQVATGLSDHMHHDIGAGSAFRRSLRPQDINFIKERGQIKASEFRCSGALLGQRILNVIYEQDLVFIPEQQKKEDGDFQAFYDPNLRTLGQMIRPGLESFLFSWLDTEIGLSGNWDKEQMRAYLMLRLAQDRSGESELCKTITQAQDPEAAGKLFLVQLASDFVTEASAMARNILGNYGPSLSELFTILIDEYGYGVHPSKHSSLFEKTLASVDLSPNVHAYWGHFLGSSLALVNYFHYISANHQYFFRYLGAMLYTEGTLYESNRQQSAMLRQVFGDKIDRQYFDEHVHIDKHHAQMALDRVIDPVIERCGVQVIPEIVRGFEEFALLQNMADRDLMAQIVWADGLKVASNKDRPLKELAKTDLAASAFSEKPAEVSVPHVHDLPEWFEVEEGALQFYASPFHIHTLAAGDAVYIPQFRHHGTLIGDQPCRYRAYPFADSAIAQ